LCEANAKLLRVLGTQVRQAANIRQNLMPVLPFKLTRASFFAMTDKQAVIDALDRLPESASLDEITEELHIMASIRHGRADIVAGRAKSHENVEQLVDSWATAWTSK
jgi:predicted transcriptional regulator